MVTDHDVWTKRLSTRDAARAGRALRKEGYKITNRKMRDLYYFINVGRYLEPVNAQERARVYDIILHALGW